MNYIDNLYPGRKFLREIRKSNNSNNVVPYVLLRGIVVGVTENIFQTQNSFQVPPYSLNVKIIGEDVSSKNPQEEQKKWYAPLMPINFIILPEIGEEVLIVREMNSTSSVGFWIGRVNETAYLSRFLAKEWSVTQEPALKYGFPFDVKDLENIAGGTTKDAKIILKSLLPGDVSIQGRSGTYHIHSFDRINKKGVIKQGTSIFRSEETPTPSGPRLVRKEIQTTTISQFTQFPLSSIINKDLSSDRLDKNKETSLIVSEAERFVAVSPLGEKLLYREVLGEKINNNIKALTDEVKNLVELLKKSIDYNTKILLEHQHTLNDVNLNASVVIPVPSVSTGNQTKDISFRLGSQKVNKTEGFSPISLATDTENINKKIDLIVGDLENNLSKTHFIN